MVRAVRSSVQSSHHGLDEAQQKRVLAFMAKAVRAFATKDWRALDSMAHSGGDARSRRNTNQFNRQLMQGGDRIVAWAARPYGVPRWSIMRTLQHAPPPTVWVDVTLHNGSREYSLYFALAPTVRGALRTCFFEERSPAKLGRRQR